MGTSHVRVAISIQRKITIYLMQSFRKHGSKKTLYILLMPLRGIRIKDIQIYGEIREIDNSKMATVSCGTLIVNVAFRCQMMPNNYFYGVI